MRSTGFITGFIISIMPIVSCGPAETDKSGSLKKPNIVIILADDMGYADAGCYGASMINTPAIDRIAREGMLFTDAHSPAAVCSPSRYGLLTGEHPMRNPMFSSGVLGIYHPLGIGENQMTIASLVKSQGYAAGVIGKWHLGLGTDPHTNYNGEVKPGPLEIGFSESYIEPGNLEGSLYLEGHKVVNYDPGDPFSWTPTEAGKALSHLRQGVTKVMMVLEGGERARLAEKPACSKLFTEKAVDFIDRQKDVPFFLYLAPNNVHVKILPGEEFMGSSDCGLYGDYMVELDWIVEEVLNALDRNELTNNTLVLFTSDNGGLYTGVHNAEAVEKGHRINGQFLGQKMNLWEGGHRIPFLVRWPGVVDAGSTSDALVSQLDLLATCAEILGVELQEEAGPDSYSFLSAMTGKGEQENKRKHLVYQSVDGTLAIRRDSWVLIPVQGSGSTSFGSSNIMEEFASIGLGFVNSDYSPEGKLKPGAPPGQLYDLSSDPNQTTNLYRKYPEKVIELSKELERIRNERPMRVFPSY